MEPKTTNKGITLLEENLWNCTAEKQISGFLGVFIQSFSGIPNCFLYQGLQKAKEIMNTQLK